LKPWKTIPTSSDLADIGVSAGYAVVFDPDLAFVEALEPVHAAEQGALARTRGTYNEDNFAPGYLEIDASESPYGAEALPGAAYPDAVRCRHRIWNIS
jgi:hypothetical protein